MKQFKPTFIGLLMFALIAALTSYAFGPPGASKHPVHHETAFIAVPAQAVVLSPVCVNSIYQAINVASNHLSIAVVNHLASPARINPQRSPNMVAFVNNYNFSHFKSFESKVVLIPPLHQNRKAYRNSKTLNPLTDKSQKIRADELRTTLS